MIRLAGVTVRLGSAVVLDGVDLHVREHELLAVLGPNGAGKSTLLSVLSGDVTPTSGRVTLDGRPLSGWRPVEQARRRAVMTQEHRVNFAFRAVDVVRMGRSPWRGTDRCADDESAVARAMDVAELLPLAERTFPTLSGGEKARTAFARALAQDVPLLLLDEPTAALDIHHTEQLLTELRALADAGAAVVAVLHDLTSAGAFADRLLLVDRGRVVADGPPGAVLRPDLLSRVYEHPVDVVPHPTTGAPIVLAARHATVPAQRGATHA
jgi:iron complex transport system ATP-binding protein